MNWTEEVSAWNTLFELKEHHENLGLKGEVFFATDFAKEISTGEYKVCIAYTAFNGMGLGKGISSFIVTKEELKEYFSPMDKTFHQLEIERKEEYLKEEAGVTEYE